MEVLDLAFHKTLLKELQYDDLVDTEKNVPRPVGGRPMPTGNSFFKANLVNMDL